MYGWQAQQELGAAVMQGVCYKGVTENNPLEDRVPLRPALPCLQTRAVMSPRDSGHIDFQIPSHVCVTDEPHGRTEEL